MICEFCSTELKGGNYCSNCGAPTPLDSRIVKLKQSEPDNQNSSNTQGQTWESGQYKIGSEIPKGEYVLISEEDTSGWVEITKDSSGDDDSSILCICFQNRLIITLDVGNYVEITDAVAYPIEYAPKVAPRDNILPSGMYKVGVDLHAGEYKLKRDRNGDDGTIEIFSDSLHNDESSVIFEYFRGSKYITVKDDQYIRFEDAYLKLN